MAVTIILSGGKQISKRTVIFFMEVALDNFCLRDGRVFNDRGRITDSDPLLYDRRGLPH